MSIPKYVGNIPGSVAYNKRIPAVVRDTYVQVRGLGVGKPKFKIALEVVQHVTGKSLSTLYEHLRLLESCKALRWSITNGVAILDFGESPNSEFSEGPFKDSDSKRLTVTELRKNKKANSENSELPRETWSEKGRELARAYVEWLGYEPGKADPQEVQDVEWLAANFTVEQIKAVYDLHKATDFWAMKQLKMKFLRTAVPEYYSALERKGMSTDATNRTNNNPTEEADQLKRDLELKARLQRLDYGTEDAR